MSKLRHIYTEKIHHLDCSKCGDSINTNDGSHEISKKQAAKDFVENGWTYYRFIGWLCEKCSPEQE
jgi:hypothetical protein